MKLTLRNKLIVHAFVIVFVTVLMSTLASVYLSRNQIKEQNKSRLQSALFRLERLINQNLNELEEKFTAFSHKDETTRVMLNCIQQDFFHFPSLPDLFELAPEMGLSRFAFYFPTKFKGPEILQIYFDKKQGGLIQAKGPAHWLYLRKGGELQQERIAAPGIYPYIYQSEPTVQMVSDSEYIQIVAHYEYISYTDATEYGSTFPKGGRIGHIILEKPLKEPLPILDRETGVLINVYNLGGRAVGGLLSMNNVVSTSTFPDDIITLSDKRGELYDSIIKPVTYGDNVIGYLSFSLSQSTTRSKLIDTIGALALIGLIASILGISGAFIVNRGIVLTINGLVNLVRKVASGDLTQTHAPPAAEILVTDEIGTMTNDLWQMTDRIRAVLKEIDGLIQSVASGDLAKRGQESHYSGAWQELVVQINRVLDAFSDPFNRTSLLINRISTGDIPQKISEPYQGDFNTIIANLNMLIDATNEATGVAEAIAAGNLAMEVKERSPQDRLMQALNAMTRRLTALSFETETMIEAVTLGKLDVRANPQAFEGGWRDLIVGINDLIDNFSQQLQLQSAQMRKLQKMESLGTLAGGIAHDFNNLLTPILGYTQVLIAEYPLDLRLNRRLHKIQIAANRARDLVQQILTFARQTEQPYQPIMIQPLIKEALKLLRATIPASIEIVANIPSGLGAIMGDPTQVHQIIMNLCTNAFHAMREQGGILAVRLEEAEIRRDQETYYSGLASGKYVRLVISDTGPGMDSKILDRIFEPYFSTKEREGGTGLGLAVVHGLVKQMKGAITVYSEIGRGTTFHILLPRIDHSAGETATPASLPLTGNHEKILVVDDEELVLDMMKEMLELLGYQVDTQSRVFEALEAFKTTPGYYDLVVTDMSMPGLSGLALSDEIMTIRADIPVVICTGFSEQITEKSLKDHGIKGFVMKPVVSKNLAEVVYKALHP